MRTTKATASTPDEGRRYVMRSYLRHKHHNHLSSENIDDILVGMNSWDSLYVLDRMRVHRSDQAALRSDWEAAGRDLGKALAEALDQQPRAVRASFLRALLETYLNRAERDDHQLRLPLGAE